MQKDLSKVLLITDMDGTFLPKNKELSEKDMKQIEAFRQRGGKFTVATGRALQASSRYFDAVKPDFAALLYNGAVAWDCNKNSAVFADFLPRFASSYAAEILQNFPEAGCEVLCLDNVYVPKLNDVEREHIGICRTNPVFCGFDEIPTNRIKVLFGIKHEMQQEMADFCNEKGYGGVDFVKSERCYFEMLPHNVSKGSGLKKLIEFYKLSGFTIFAAGDYDNDIEMLRCADFGFAVANAQDSVKNAADIVLKSSCEDCPMTEILNFIYNEWDGGKNNER